MKRIAYDNFYEGKSFVDYEIFDGHTYVFSGINDDGTSTVNAAERIIKTIIEKEAVPLEFYDLQTQLGYRYIRPGKYVFRKLIFENPANPQVSELVPQFLPPKVFEAFRGHIEE